VQQKDTFDKHSNLPLTVKNYTNSRVHKKRYNQKHSSLQHKVAIDKHSSVLQKDLKYGQKVLKHYAHGQICFEKKKLFALFQIDDE